jgi:hypothetical protein
MTATGSLLQAVIPEWHFAERHAADVAASQEACFAAIRDLTAPEVRTLAPLLAVRSLPGLVRRPGRAAAEGFGGMIRRSGSKPLIQLFLDAGFAELGVDEPRELVAGVIGRFWRPVGAEPIPFGGADEFVAFDEPGYAKAALNFTVEPRGSGSLVATETRIVATSEDARRRFGRYWIAIRAGNGLIRRSWLAGVRRRAERG